MYVRPACRSLVVSYCQHSDRVKRRSYLFRLLFFCMCYCRQQLRIGKLSGARISNCLLLRWILRTYWLQPRTGYTYALFYNQVRQHKTTVWSRKPHKLHSTILMQRLDIKLNGFHQNVREVQGNKARLQLLCSC